MAKKKKKNTGQQRKSGATRARKKRYRGPHGGQAAPEAGAMQRMVGGFRRAVGRDGSSGGGMDVALWALVVIAVGAIAFFGFGR